jgi:hypothetical protein
VEEVEEDTDTVLLPDYPEVLELVVLRHVLQVVLDEVVDVLAEDVHARLSEQLLVAEGVDDELQEEHEEQVEGLECFPADLGADCTCKFEKSISNTDISLRVNCGSRPCIQINIHFGKDLDFIEMGLVEVLHWHFQQKLGDLSHHPFRVSLSLYSLLLSLRRKNGFWIWWLGGTEVVLRVFLILLGLDGRASSLLILRGRFGDLAGRLGDVNCTLPSCFCLIWVKSAA